MSSFTMLVQCAVVLLLVNVYSSEAHFVQWFRDVAKQLNNNANPQQITPETLKALQKMMAQQQAMQQQQAVANPNARPYSRSMPPSVLLPSPLSPQSLTKQIKKLQQKALGATDKLTNVGKSLCAANFVGPKQLKCMQYLDKVDVVVKKAIKGNSKMLKDDIKAAAVEMVKKIG